MMAEWLIFGVVILIGWALEHAITKAHHTLIELHQTLRSLELDVAQIRDRVAGRAPDVDENLYGLE